MHNFNPEPPPPPTSSQFIILRIGNNYLRYLPTYAHGARPFQPRSEVSIPPLGTAKTTNYLTHNT